MSSGAGESRPRALSEPYVSVSAHTAPVIQPKDRHQAANGQITAALAELIFEATFWLSFDAYAFYISYVPILQDDHLTHKRLGRVPIYRIAHSS